MRGQFFGGCACGGIRYSGEGEPLFSMNCHCRDCQRESGSAYSQVLGVPGATFKVIQGSPKFFDLTADSGHTTRRAFCANCGSPLFGRPTSVPDIVTIRGGSLDVPSVILPRHSIYTSSA